MAMKLNSQFLEISLYAGVFVLAYAGFLYQEYTTRQSAHMLPHNEFANHLPVESVYPNEPEPAVGNKKKLLAYKIETSHPEHAAAYSLAESSSSGSNITSEMKRGKPSFSSPVQNDTDYKHNNISTFNHAERVANKSPQITNSSVADQKNAAYKPPVVALANTAAVKQTPGTSTYNSAKVSDAIANTGGNQDSIVAVGASSSTTSTSTNGNNSVSQDTYSTDTENLPMINEQPWPKPGCPLELEQGSTEADARQMQEIYGCRYMEYCQMVNDGNDAYRCWWGFYS